MHTSSVASATDDRSASACAVSVDDIITVFTGSVSAWAGGVGGGADGVDVGAGRGGGFGGGDDGIDTGRGGGAAAFGDDGGAGCHSGSIGVGGRFWLDTTFS